MTKITRINDYDDKRYSKTALLQHGAFQIDDQHAVEVVIVNSDSAQIRGAIEHVSITDVIDEFRHYSEHIVKFYDDHDNLLAQFPKPDIFNVQVSNIQPSQFYVDCDKVNAMEQIITQAEDIVIPLIKYNNRLASLDGHTRLYIACRRNYQQVCGFYSSAGNYITDFINEAIARKITSPNDLIPLSHDDYSVRWLGYCREYFNNII